MRDDATTNPEGNPGRRARRLEYATIGWNIGEAVLTIGLGAVAGSVALMAFGTVSVVEVFASSVVVWHLGDANGADDAERTRRALRLIAASFAVLGVALAIAAINDLISRRVPGSSIVGIVYLGITAIVMFWLAYRKSTLAREIGSEPLRSEATVTFIDGILSVSTLTGLALNAFLDWWWADPAAALVVAVAAMNEGRETWLETTRE